jgi:hypothetical protein
MGAALGSCGYISSGIMSLGMKPSHRKNWTGTDTLAYFAPMSFTMEKSFVTVMPDAIVMKPFTAIIYKCS